MTAYERAQRYVSMMPAAVSGQGGHGQTLEAACVLVHGFGLSESEAAGILNEYNSRCVPPWSDRELKHKLEEAGRITTHQKPRGHLRGRVSYEFGGGESGAQWTTARGDARPPAIGPTKKSKRLGEIAKSAVLPKGMEDAARRLLLAGFEEGEGIGIAQEVLGEDGRGTPKDSGPTLSREEWLRKLDGARGDPNRIFSSAAKTGAFIRVNPLKIGGSKDSDVTVFRHVLLEFDRISLEEQWNLIEQSNVPCTAILHSGNRSLHAWVRVDAKSREEYGERVRVLFDFFEGYGLDDKNKNPSRFSRLPGMVRGKGQQSLLALNVGAATFSAWSVDLDQQGTGQTISIDELADFDAGKDDGCLLGDRWLGRGYSCIWQAQTGVGKSSLAMQAAMTWAIGRPFLGIIPVRALKSLIVQNENDLGDVAEVFQGVCAGLSVERRHENWYSHLVFKRQRGQAGLEFLGKLDRLCEEYKPDLVWIDPLYCFFGADLSSQRDCSEFFTALGAMLERSAACVHFVHHTGKPPKDPKAAKLKGGARSYDGLGSSIIPNWMRAVISIEDAGDGLFKVMFTKRGKRAGALSASGTRTNEVWLKWAQDRIFWEQVAEPEKPVREKGKSGRPVVEFDKDRFVASIQADADGKVVQLAKGRLVKLIETFAGVGETKAKELADQLREKFYNEESKMYVF